MTVRTWVGRFSIVQGRVEEEGPWLGSFVRQLQDESDELYAIVEPALPGSDEFCGQLLEVIGKLYRGDTLSLTGAILRAVRAAHEQLVEWNRRSLRQHRVAAGISCLALRDQTAYLAQAGPSLAYFRQADGGFTRIEPDETDPAEAIGLAENFYPQLSRHRLEPGDQMVIASTNLDQLADEETVAGILASGPDEALPQLYLLARSLEDFSLILITAFEQPDAAVEEPPHTLTVEREIAPEAAAGGVATVALGGPELLAQTAPTGSPAAEALLEGTPAASPPLNGHGNGFAKEVADLAGASAPLDVSRPVVRMKRPSAGISYRRTTGALGLRLPHLPRPLLLAAVVIAALALLGWWVLRPSINESRQDHFNTLLSSAQASFQSGRTQQDAAEKRRLYLQAQNQLADAEKIHADNADLQALKSDLAGGIAELDAVSDLGDMTEVVNLANVVSGELSVTRVVVGGGQAYLLDAKGKRVLAVPAGGGANPNTLLQEGGLAGFERVGKPVQIAWGEETQSLLVMDDQRQLFALVPGKDPLPLTLRGATELGSVDAIAYSGRNLYILDTKNGQVWRYLPTDTGFDSERTSIVAADLTGASELAVGNGDVYLLMRDGRVRRFEGGQERPFDLAGIDRAPSSPASMQVLDSSSRLILADRGNKRVLIASADGRFQRQLISNSMTELRSVAVDEKLALVYVLVRDTLYRAPLPPA